MPQKSHPHRPGQREAGGFADGAVGFHGMGRDGVGGVLDGAAAGVEAVEELVAVEKGEAREILGEVKMEGGIPEVGNNER